MDNHFNLKHKNYANIGKLHACISSDNRLFVSKKLKHELSRVTQTYNITHLNVLLTYNQLISMSNFVSVITFKHDFVFLLDDGTCVFITNVDIPLEKINTFYNYFKEYTITSIESTQFYFVVVAGHQLFLIKNFNEYIEISNSVHSYYCNVAYLFYWEYVSRTTTLTLKIYQIHENSKYSKFIHLGCEVEFSASMLSSLNYDDVVSIHIDFSESIYICTLTFPIIYLNASKTYIPIYAEGYIKEIPNMNLIVETIESILNIISIYIIDYLFICILSNGKVCLFGDNENYRCFVDAKNSMDAMDAEDITYRYVYTQQSNCVARVSNGNLISDAGFVHAIGKKSNKIYTLQINNFTSSHKLNSELTKKL